MYYNDFAGWVREQLDTGPYSDDTDAARKLGVPPSTVTRWLGIRYPTRATTRQVATLFDVPIHEVLVAGGCMTPAEATSITLRTRRNRNQSASRRTHPNEHHLTGFWWFKSSPGMLGYGDILREQIDKPLL